MFNKDLTNELLSKTTKVEHVPINNGVTSSSSSTPSNKNEDSSLHVPKTQCPRCKHFFRNDIYQSHLNSHIAKITDYLYLGSEANARNRKELTCRGVKICSVLNVAAECDNYYPDLFVGGETYLKLPLYDEVDAGDEMRSKLESAFKYIDRARHCSRNCLPAEAEAHTEKKPTLGGGGGSGMINDTCIPDNAEHTISNTTKTEIPCLVHCIQGISRSSSIVIGYLVNREGWSLRRALDHVRLLRPIIRPNRGFAEVLLELELKLNGGNSITVDEILQM